MIDYFSSSSSCILSTFSLPLFPNLLFFFLLFSFSEDINMYVGTSLLSSNSSLPSSEYSCSVTSIFVLTAFSVTKFLLIFPLSTLILYLGYQRYRQQRYTAAAAAMSHSDIFTYHIIVMETITVSVCLLFCVSAYIDLREMMMMKSQDIFLSIWSTKIHFHTLTCVEQYLAVAHPVSYLSLKSTGGVRIRNFSIGCVWLCFVCMTAVALTSNMANMIVYFCLVAFSLIVVCFFCTSALCILRHPGPGEVGRYRERVDHQKRRAFYTIVAIMIVLSLCLGGMLVDNALDSSLELSNNNWCVVIMCDVWFSLPSSLVLPLLYLHRTGKLPGCKHNSESG